MTPSSRLKPIRMPWCNTLECWETTNVARREDSD